MHMLTRVAIALSIEIFVFGVLLFGGAGTFSWPAAWVLLLLFAGTAMALSTALARQDPALLEERMKSPFQAEQPLWDKVFLGAMSVMWCSWLALMGMDVVRFGWSHLPVWVQVAGGAGFMGGNWIIYRTFQENTFAAPVVKVQFERGHKVISTGPYAIVRHPMYAGASLYIPSIALLLGSAWGVVASLLMIGTCCYRITREEAELEKNLEGYAAYKKRVKYRLIPGFW